MGIGLGSLAFLCRDGNLTNQLGPDLGALFIVLSLLVFNIRPFTMACHV